ncbi:MAG: hypothetical protein H0T42_29020 [Deltaproteobacteria bacterium]|nr:hypothetical protein [Deltaproteobacteria bacterium]
MRTRVVLFAGVLASRAAHADDNPRDLFGLGKKPTAEAPVSCDVPHTFGCATITDPLDDASPYGLATWLPASYLRRLPTANATHDSVAHYAAGASRDETGPSFGGATGLENRWTIDGAPSDDIRTGGSDTQIPLTFLDGITVMAGGFTARDRASTGGRIDAQLIRGGTKHVLATEVWGGIAGESRRRPVASGSYSVRRLASDAGPDLGVSIVGSGPLGAVLRGRAWYAAGIAPVLSSTEATWTASRLIDGNGDGSPDGLPGPAAIERISIRTKNTLDYFVPVMLRTGWDRGAHHVELTLIGHGSRVTRFLQNSTLQAAGVDRSELVADGIATWRGRWAATRALVQLAWHRSDRHESPHDDAAGGPQLLSAYVPMDLPEDSYLAMRCHDGTYPNIAQCAVPFGYFASAGAGGLVDSVGDRPTATAEIAHRRGAHVVRTGATLEDSRLIVSSQLSGGEQYRSLFPGHLDRLRYYSGDCEEIAGAPCDYVTESQLRYRTRYAAAYVEETFTPGDRIRVDGGLRWELMWVGTRLHFSNQLAPRLGAAWDILGDGRSRVWTSMGRSFPMLPAGLGPTVIRRDATVHDASNPVGESRTTDAGAAFRVAQGIEPMAQDEVTAGVELGLAKTFRVIEWVQGRWLRRGLETTPDGFDNPGRTTELLPARRASEQLALEIATAPTAKLTLRAGYLAGRTVGNFPGPYDPRQGVILYNGADFNGPTVSANELGKLPTDVGHRVFVEADRRGTVFGISFDVATRLTLASGRPRNAVADTELGVLHLIPRGSAGRGPMIAQANLRLAAHWRGFDLILDVFNAFDRGGPTVVDEVYGELLLRPIEGGSYQDLVFLKDTNGAPAERRTAYGLPVVFQGPISASVGVRREF